MNKELMEKLFTWPKPYIFSSDFQVLLGIPSKNALRSSIKRSVQEGYLLRLRRDFYLIKRIEKTPCNPLEIAPLIYGPSCISFESSLSYHGWIPEAVFTTTSACLKRSTKFSTPIGTFSYQKIPAKIYPVGIQQISENGITFFIADPWKAIADIAYSKKCFWAHVEDLENDLRIEKDVLEKSNLNLLLFLSQNYPHKKTASILTSFYKDLVL